MCDVIADCECNSECIPLPAAYNTSAKDPDSLVQYNIAQIHKMPEHVLLCVLHSYQIHSMWEH